MDEACQPKSWSAFGGNWTNQRYSGLDQINAQNAKTLGGAWTFKFEANASTRATPVVKDGVMFVSAGSRLNALDAKTGKLLWSWRPSDTAPAALESAGIADLLNSGFGIPSPPGVSVGEGIVFVGLMDGHVAAVRQKTGELVWSTQLGYEPPRTGQAVSGVPLYANGVVARRPRERRLGVSRQDGGAGCEDRQDPLGALHDSDPGNLAAGPEIRRYLETGRRRRVDATNR